MPPRSSLSSRTASPLLAQSEPFLAQSQLMHRSESLLTYSRFFADSQLTHCRRHCHCYKSGPSKQSNGFIAEFNAHDQLQPSSSCPGLLLGDYCASVLRALNPRPSVAWPKRQNALLVCRRTVHNSINVAIVSSVRRVRALRTYLSSSLHNNVDNTIVQAAVVVLSYSYTFDPNVIVALRYAMARKQ